MTEALLKHHASESILTYSVRVQPEKVALRAIEALNNFGLKHIVHQEREGLDMNPVQFYKCLADETRL